MTEYATFRQRLDAVLRTRDVQQVQAFMIEEDQWSPDVPTDPTFAMWMMIAGSPALKELHTEARAWLIEHGHAEEADALLSRSQSKPGKQPSVGQQKAQQRPGQKPARSQRGHERRS